MTSSAMPMSSRYVPVCCSWRCLVVIRWISCIRRRADRVRSRNPLIRRRSSAAARRTDQARDDANDIPQQRVVGRMMNVGLHHRGVDTQLLAVLQSELDRRLHHQIIDRLERLGRQPIEAAVERVVSRHRQTIEVGELAQCASVGNPLAQFAIVPVLDAHQNQRAQHLLRRQAAATGLGLLQAPRQIAADLLDHVLLVVKKIGNRLQQRLKTQALTHQLQIGKTDLPLRCPGHAQPSSLFAASARSRFNALMYRGAAWCSRSCRARPLSRLR